MGTNWSDINDWMDDLLYFLGLKRIGISRTTYFVFKINKLLVFL